MRVLVIAAHHDDETLGVGGTIARLTWGGHQVYVSVLGQGPAARKGTDPRVAVQNHQMALKHLGAQALAVGEYLPDNQFDTISTLLVAQVITAAIDGVHPDVVYTHHFGDINQDHRKVHKATMIATRTHSSSVKQVYMYEVPGATGCDFRRENAFVPDWFEPISLGHLNMKIDAMEMYESERRPYPHPRSPKKLRAKAEDRGAQAGVHLAEAFELVRWVR